MYTQKFQNLACNATKQKSTIREKKWNATKHERSRQSQPQSARAATKFILNMSILPDKCQATNFKNIYQEHWTHCKHKSCSAASKITDKHTEKCRTWKINANEIRTIYEHRLKKWGSRTEPNRSRLARCRAVCETSRNKPTASKPPWDDIHQWPIAFRVASRQV